MFKCLYNYINIKIIILLLVAAIAILFTGCNSNQNIEEVQSTENNNIDKIIDANKVIDANKKSDTSIDTLTEEVEEDINQGNEKVDVMIQNMSIEEKVGQLFLIHCNSNDYDMMQYSVGGIILFNDSIKDKDSESMKEYINSYQVISKIPLLVGVDEEGGSVVRVGGNSKLSKEEFKSPQELYAIGGLELIAEDTKKKSNILKELGFNLNLSPVADISTNEKDYIYNRTIGKDVDDTSTYISTVVSEMDKINMGNTLKHFPGYGNNKDSHEDITIDKREYQCFEKNDFQPFKAGVLAGADSILVSHNIVLCIDEEKPASISYKVINIIRNNLKFNGVIMTDDMGMKGIVNYLPEDEAAVEAILAGNDMIISTNYKVQIEAVTKAVYDGRITEDRLNESVRRILVWKDKLGLLH